MFPAVPFLPPGLSGFRRGIRHLSPAARFTVTLYPCQHPFITVRCTGSAHLPNTGEPCRRCIGCKNTTGPPSRVIRSPNKTTIIIFPAIGVRVPFGSRTYFFVLRERSCPGQSVPVMPCHPHVPWSGKQNRANAKCPPADGRVLLDSPGQGRRAPSSSMVTRRSGCRHCTVFSSPSPWRRQPDEKSSVAPRASTLIGTFTPRRCSSLRTVTARRMDRRSL